jgi:transposase
MSSWRAGCGGTRTSGSGQRTGETSRRKAEIALRSDSHYWVADTLQELGAAVHLVNPSGLAWEGRRVKNDYRDCCDLLDRMRLGKLPEAWIAPHEVRELRELVRFPARLVMLRTGLKAQLKAVLAKHGLRPPVKDLWGVAGPLWLDQLDLPRAYTTRIESIRDLVEVYDREIDMLEREIHRQLTVDRGTAYDTAAA